MKGILEAAFKNCLNDIYVEVGRLSNSAAGYDSLQHFISAVRLEAVFVEEPRLRNKNAELDQSTSDGSIPRNSKGPPKLTIWVMPMHAAKGLEFDEVILPFWSKGTSMDLEEERKIAFMSLTRAKRRVMISYSYMNGSSGIQLAATGASFFVDKLLHIPGLRVTHEVFASVAPFKLDSKGPDHNAYSLQDTTDKSGLAFADQNTQVSKYNSPPKSRDIGTVSSLPSSPSSKSYRPVQKVSTGIMEGSADGMHVFLDPKLKSLVMGRQSKKSPTPTSEITPPQFQPISTTSAVDAIVVENLAKAVRKKKCKKVDVEFPDASTIDLKEISELLIDQTVRQPDLQLYLRQVIKLQLNLLKGSIIIGDKTKGFAACTAQELAEFIRISLIKKHGT